MGTLTHTYFITLQQILQHIRDHLYDPIPSFDMSFNDIISGGIQSESVTTLDQPDTLYASVGHYLNPMSNAHAYATHIEITAANHIFNININVTFAGTNYPSTHPEPGTRATFCTRPYHPALQLPPVPRLNAKHHDIVFVKCSLLSFRHLRHSLSHIPEGDLV